MRTAVQRGPETDALLTVLNGVVLTGDGQRPDGGGFANDSDPTSPFTGYAVLYPGITTSVDGPINDTAADTTSEYQVTSVGVTRAQAALITDTARAALLNTPVAVAGRRVQLVTWTLGQPAQRDDDTTPPLFYAVDLYEITTSPA